MLTLTFSTSNTLNRFYSSTDGSQTLLELSSELYQPLEPDGTLEPPTEPDPTYNVPPIPTAYQPPGYQVVPFDYLTLPRLSTQKSDTLITSVTQTKLIHNSIDLGDHFLSGDCSDPLSGSTSGRLTLATQVTTSNQILTRDYFSVGDRIQWLQCLGSKCRLVKNFYIVSTPKLTTSEQNLSTIQLELGCELEYFSKQSLEPSVLYCGRDPKTAQDAAQIYAKIRKLPTKTYPNGHFLLEPPQNFIKESPYDFLQLLYAPTNQDVRSKLNGSVQVTKRPSYNPSKATRLNYSQCLTVPSPFSSSYKPASSVRAHNTYTLKTDFATSDQFSQSTSGTIDNDNPWFENGYTLTQTKTTSIGDTVVYKRTRLFGYIPTLASFPKENLNDGCIGTALTTEYGLVSEKVLKLTYSKHVSGSFLVWKEEEYEIGYSKKEVDGTVFITQGIQSYKLTTYRNVAQKSDQVCTKDYKHLALKTRTLTYGLDSNDDYRLLSATTDIYKAQRGIEAVGSPDKWQKFTTSGNYDEATGSWLKQPLNITRDTNPPSSQWVRPNSEERSPSIEYLSESLEELLGSIKANPINAPACFNQPQLRTFADRYLKEVWGLSEAISIVVPPRFDRPLGSSIAYTDTDNVTRRYIVYNREINQTGCISTVSLVLMRVL